VWALRVVAEQEQCRGCPRCTTSLLANRWASRPVLVKMACEGGRGRSDGADSLLELSPFTALHLTADSNEQNEGLDLVRSTLLHLCSFFDR